MRANPWRNSLLHRRSAGRLTTQIAGGLIAGAAVLVLVALAPVHVAEIHQDWQVAAAARSLAGSISVDALGPYVLVLRYISVVACLAVSLFLLWRRPGHPVAALASVALATLPVSMNLGGYTETWPYPSPWAEYLQVLTPALSAAGWLALIAFAALFPGGRLRSRWSTAAAVAGLTAPAVFLFGPGAGLGEATWFAGALLVFGSLALATAGQVALLRRARPDEKNRTRGVVLVLLSWLAAFLLAVLGDIAGDLPVIGPVLPVINLHLQAFLAMALPIAVARSVARHRLWEDGNDGPAPGARLLRMTGAVIALAVVLSGGLPLYAAARAPDPAPLLPAARPLPIIIDTDLSHDDILALLVLLRHPAVDVSAVAISGTGEVRCDAGIRNARAILALAGRGEVPVACGRETPLSGDHVFPTAWRDNADALYGVTLPAAAGGATALSATELIQDAVNAAATKPAILTLGPLTNVAEALQTEPGLANRVTAIFAMGGAVRVAGNIAASGEGIDNATAEWNVWVDPRAANIVLASGSPIVLVPLDATRHVPASMDFLSALQAYRHTPVAEFAYELLRSREDFVRSGGYQFWDVLAATLLIREQLARYQNMTVRVIEAEGPDGGRTVAAGDGYAARIAVWADRERFEKLFLETLNR